MSNKDDIRHRLSIDVDAELYSKLQRYVPWGLMRPLITTILTDFIYLCEKHDPKIILGAILSEEISLKDFLNKYKEELTSQKDNG